MATARIPVDLYNEIYGLIERNNQTLQGPLTVGELLCSAAKYCIEEDIFTQNEEEEEFRLHGE